MFEVQPSGSFDRTEKFLRRMSSVDILSILNLAGQRGVQALSNATPVDTGLTSQSWNFKVEQRFGSYSITWTNSNVDENGQPVAILLQYGHATGTGGYVQGIDFINPAIRPIFDQIAADVWKVVTTS